MSETKGGGAARPRVVCGCAEEQLLQPGLRQMVQPGEMLVCRPILYRAVQNWGKCAGETQSIFVADQDPLPPPRAAVGVPRWSGPREAAQLAGHGQSAGGCSTGCSGSHPAIAEWMWCCTAPCHSILPPVPMNSR